MNKSFLVVPVIAFLASTDVLAVDRPFIGVLDVPGLFGAPTASGMPGADAPENPALPLFQAPGDAEPVRVVHEPERIEHNDIEYERSGAIAYERNREGWFLVFDHGSETESRGYFWVNPESSTTFKSYFSLVEGGSYLNPDWDRKVYPYVKWNPAADVPAAGGTRLSQETYWAVPVKSMTDANGRPWVLAVFFNMSECESETGIIEVVGAGYVPAHLPNGEPTFAWATYC